MRICSSVGSVTVAVPLLVTAISFLLLLEVLQHDVQPLPSLLTHVNHAHRSEHPQMLGHLWLRQPEQAHQLVDGALPAGEDVQDLAPPGLGHRVERICCRRCSCHGKNHIPLWAYVKPRCRARLKTMAR